MEIFFKVLPKKGKILTQQDCHFSLYEGFYEFGNIKCWKEELEMILANTIKVPISYGLKSAGSILYFASYFQKLIYTAHYMFLNHNSTPIQNPDWSDLLDNRALEKNPLLIDRISFLPQALKLEEIQNPMLYLNRFFYHKTVKIWSKQWNIILDFSLSNSNIMESIDDDLFEDIAFYPGLLEACYLIFVRDFNTKPKANEND
ncbi:hypothetical protein Belba_3669 [Belliella baltica DSM 15883]|uniref:Uncharacterized protein n=1 Tax=Belliella baltica (strain DSM 15883 / CIP 108006 / LMG 21964 / BA134) TaxID=866536 RepID=I3ZA92_BELBD|nr:hypothetical protein [Belliella baltica]AFL86160.1 hypothetical protein Belba_3669 [Belliella baltica DSM 15883]